MRGNTRFLFPLLLVLLCAACAPAPQVDPAPEATSPAAEADPIPCYLTSDPIEIDGRPDEAAWERAPEIPLRFDGVGNPVSPTRASARFLWDGKELFVAMTAQDRDVGSTLTGRDARLWEEDVLELFIKPLESSPLYYEFEFSPATRSSTPTSSSAAPPWTRPRPGTAGSGWRWPWTAPSTIRRTTTGAGPWSWPFPWPICTTPGIPSLSRGMSGRRQPAGMTMTLAGSSR